jgi:secondary thiamine-phosphate synthase enzyme
MQYQTIRVQTQERNTFIDISRSVEEAVQNSPYESGIVCVFTPHTTAAVTINENADPDVLHDLTYKIKALIPEHDGNYRHAEGNSDSHLKSSLFSPSLTLIFENKKCVLGTWQGIYFCEFDGPRTRKVYMKIIGDGPAQKER